MKQGFTVGMSGRDMFMFDPKMVSNEVKKFVKKNHENFNKFFSFQDDDEEGGEAYDLATMSKDNDENAEEDQVKVHEIKFDEFGIMDDGLEESTADQLKNLGEGDDEAEGATAIDEDLFEDEDLEELEEDMQNLDV